MIIETANYIQIGTWAKVIGLNSRELAYSYVKAYNIEVIEIDGRKFIDKKTPNPRRVIVKNEEVIAFQQKQKERILQNSIYKDKIKK
jgi:hypothetical protein